MKEFSVEVLRDGLVWVCSSQGNSKQFFRICCMDEQERAQLLQEALPPNAMQEDRENVVTHVDWWKGSPQSKLDEHPGRRRVVRRYVGVAATVIGLVAGGAVYLALSEPSIKISSGVFATPVSSLPETKWLSDGTAVTLDAGTTLRIGFSDARRDVRLYEGKATFDVAEDKKQPKRPFVVNTHVGSVRAGRTKFMVAVDTGGIDVQVYEGEVQILRHKKSGSVIKLKGGEPAIRIPVDDLPAVAANGTDAFASVLPSG